MHLRKRFAVPLAVALWTLAVTGVANASYVYQGKDVSYGTDANRRVVVCDMETDSHGVHADSYSFAGKYHRVDDLDGSHGYCYESVRMSSGLAQHRTVEEVKWRPDYKSGWSYH